MAVAYRTKECNFNLKFYFFDELPIKIIVANTQLFDLLEHE